jgi:2',5'-phosphodiesterase
VANTHLFFHPRAPHIRSLHVAAMLAEAGALMAALPPPAPGRSQNRQPLALLFCGDLNSDLNDGVPGALCLILKMPLCVRVICRLGPAC